MQDLWCREIKKKDEKRRKNMICPNCGTQLPDQARFCGVCGAALVQQSAPQQAAWQQGMQTGMPVPPMGGQPKKGKKLKTVLSVIAVLAVLIGGLVGYSVFCMKRTYESDNGKYSAEVGYAELSINGNHRGGAFFSCDPDGVIVLNFMRGYAYSEDNVYFRLEVPKSWMKTGRKVKLSDLRDDAELTLSIGNESVSTEDDDWWSPEDMKFTFEKIDFSGLRLPGEDYAFLPFGVCKISFYIEFYYAGKVYTLEGFGVTSH